MPGNKCVSRAIESTELGPISLNPGNLRQLRPIPASAPGGFGASFFPRMHASQHRARSQFLARLGQLIHSHRRINRIRLGLTTATQIPNQLPNRLRIAAHDHARMQRGHFPNHRRHRRFGQLLFKGIHIGRPTVRISPADGRWLILPGRRNQYPVNLRPRIRLTFPNLTVHDLPDNRLLPLPPANCRRRPRGVFMSLNTARHATPHSSAKAVIDCANASAAGDPHKCRRQTSTSITNASIPSISWAGCLWR